MPNESGGTTGEINLRRYRHGLQRAGLTLLGQLSQTVQDLARVTCHVAANTREIVELRMDQTEVPLRHGHAMDVLDEIAETLGSGTIRQVHDVGFERLLIDGDTTYRWCHKSSFS